MSTEGWIADCRARYRTTPSVPVLRLCDDAEALLARVRELEAAIAEAFDLIWNQDAAYVEGGPERLDGWAKKYGMGVLKIPAGAGGAEGDTHA